MKSLRNEISLVVSGKFIISALIMPLIFATVFGYIFSNSQINESKLAVIDEDNSLYSRELINKLDASQYIEVAAVFHQTIKPEELLYNEKYISVLYLPRGLEQNRYQGRQSNIGFLVDFTVPATSADLRSGVNEVFAMENTATSLGRLKAMGLNGEQAMGTMTNLSLQQRLLFNPMNDYVNLTVIGFVNIIALSLLTMQTIRIIPRLRAEGKLHNELSNPFALLSRVLPYVITSCITLFFALGILKQVGGFRFAGNPLEFLLPLFLYTLVSGLIGLLLGWTAKIPTVAMARGFGVVITSFLLSGIQTPVALFPKSIQILSNMLPLTWNLKFIRGIGLRGGDLGYFQQEIGVFLLMLAVVVLLLILNMFKEGKKHKTTVQQAVSAN